MCFTFQNLLESCRAETHLELIAELDYKTRSGATSGLTARSGMRCARIGAESKDQYDDLDAEKAFGQSATARIFTGIAAEARAKAHHFAPWPEPARGESRVQIVLL